MAVYGLQFLFQCHHPSLWTFMDGISMDIQKQKASFLRGISGAHQPPKKKYRDLKDRVGRAVSLYLSANILQFLQSMAHLSHQQLLNDYINLRTSPCIRSPILSKK